MQDTEQNQDVKIPYAGLETLKGIVEMLMEHYVRTEDVAQYSLKKQETAEEGFAATYWFTKDGQRVGDAINIEKDRFLKSAQMKIAAEDNHPVEGCRAGDKYIDLLIETEDSSGTGRHLYLLLKDMVEPVKQGDGIRLSDENEIAIQIDPACSNGLSAGTEGLALALATAESAGAMSAEDKKRLDSLQFTEISKEEVKAMFTPKQEEVPQE